MKNIRCAVCAFVAIPILFTVFTSTSVFAAPPAPPEITEFRFEVEHNPGLTEDIIADIYGDTLIVGIIPFQQTDLNLKATFVAGAENVQVDGVDQLSTVTINDFSTAVSYDVTTGGDSKTYKVRLIYTGLPVVYVYTEGGAPILNKEDYVDGTIKIYPTDESEIFSGEMGIRGRGNTTWTFPKKPYRVKLGTAASILGMPSDKDWVLLANYADKSLIRNTLAYDLGWQMNFAYTPRMTHVELVLNGVYQGNYAIGEHIKVDKDRVKVEELENGDIGEDVINGGYFLELDDYRDGIYFELASGLPFVIKSPDEDELADEQFEFIRNYMQETEDVIYSEGFADPENGYAKYINRETFIEYYWVQEVLKNIDAKDVSSIFYYKERDEKLNMGPLWDLDVAAGNASVNGGDDPTSFYVRESHWFKRLFEDPDFKRAADTRWFTFRDQLLVNLPDMIDAYAEKLALSQKHNFYKWTILNQPIWPRTDALGSYEAEVEYLKEWLMERIAWIDANIEEPMLTEFNLVAPEDNATVMLTPGDEGNLEFKWTTSLDGIFYKVFIDEAGGDFTNSVAVYASDESSMDTTAAVALADLRELLGENDSLTLNWTVYAAIGDDSLKAAETFSIKLVNGVMGIPVLHSPAADEVVENLSPAMKWMRAHLAESYQVQVSTTPGFESPVVDSTVETDTTFVVTVPLAEQTTYYWRVRSVNAGGEGDWSEVRTFTTPLISGVGENIYGVSMFPNPTSRELYIETPLSTLIENAQLVDALGRTAVHSALVPGSTTKIDVSSLQRGMYVVILRGRMDKPLTKKIVLK